MNPLDYVAHETERQSGTIREALGMHEAWKSAVMRHGLGFPVIETVVITWARYINGQDKYRRVPAVFNQGTPALEASLIPNAMERLFKSINDPKGRMLTTDEYTKEFLEIHPFADGNGRVGSLLWNFLNGTLGDPEPMPYFFGEGSR